MWLYLCNRYNFLGCILKYIYCLMDGTITCHHFPGLWFIFPKYFFKMLWFCFLTANIWVMSESPKLEVSSSPTNFEPQVCIQEFGLFVNIWTLSQSYFKMGNWPLYLIFIPMNRHLKCFVLYSGRKFTIWPFYDWFLSL